MVNSIAAHFPILLAVLLGVARPALACSVALPSATFPGGWGSGALPANAPALGVTTVASGLLLVGPLNGAVRTEQTPSRVLWKRPSEAAAALPAVETVGTQAYYVIPVSGLIAGDYQLEALGNLTAMNKIASIKVEAAAPLPVMKGGVIQMPTEQVKFYPKSDIINSCGPDNPVARHAASGTVKLDADFLPWLGLAFGAPTYSTLYASQDRTPLSLYVNRTNEGPQLNADRNYACPHAAGVQSREGALKLFGVGTLATVRVSDNIPGCSSSDATSDGGCSVSAGTSGSVWSAGIALLLVLLGRRVSARRCA